MKLYERPELEIRSFEVEDVITASGEVTAADWVKGELENSTANIQIFNWE